MKYSANIQVHTVYKVVTLHKLQQRSKERFHSLHTINFFSLIVFIYRLQYVGIVLSVTENGPEHLLVHINPKVVLAEQKHQSHHVWITILDMIL